MDKNMRYWTQLKQPPTTALRPILGGRLKGKTDINPQWRLGAMTTTFGPCGIGWKYEIIRLWSEGTNDHQLFAFAEIKLSIKEGDSWSEPIPGIGGSMLVEKESAGLHANDEGYKMAVTDALSVAMKTLGVAADIYMGRWDGTKYAGEAQDTISPTQLTTINDLINLKKVDLVLFLKFIEAKTLREIPAGDYNKAISALKSKKGPKETTNDSNK